MRLTKDLPNELETRLKKSIFVGRLAREQDLAFTSFIESPVMFQDDSKDNLIFHLICLSPIPEEFSQHFYYQNHIFRGNTRSPNNIQKLRNAIPNFSKLSDEKKKEKLTDYLQEKLVLFTVAVLGTTVYAELLRIENVTLQQSYDLIPSPTVKKREEFEKRMKTKRPIVLDHYPNVFPNPPFLYFDKHIYANVRLDRHVNPMTYYVNNPDEVVRFRANRRFIEQIQTRHDDHVYVVTSEYLSELQRLAKEEGIPLSEAMPDYVEEYEEEIPQRMETEPSTQKRNDTVSRESGFTAVSENVFLERFREITHGKGLYFDETDLLNFHTSIKTSLLTILGGMSGTGKSKMALLYAEALGLVHGRGIKLIPISPSYHEPSDILGFYNATTDLYHESETGLVGILRSAEERPEELFVVVFDEMNLAQVEHWFSPFISLLELDEDQRLLPLFQSEDESKNGYRPVVRIGDNVIFIGTVNFDETTKGFSDRLLDRSNVIVPKVLPFREVRELQSRGQASATKASPDRLKTSSHTLRNEWLKSKDVDFTAFTEEEVWFFDEMHQLLYSTDGQRGISFRVLSAIAKYISNVPDNKGSDVTLSRGAAIDLQVKQRILTKISGLESAIGTLVGSFEQESYRAGLLTELFDLPEAKRISDFMACRELLRNKAKELMVHGFSN